MTRPGNRADAATDPATGAGRVIVVGAGPSGLTAARTLALAGVPVLLCEAEDGPGRLSRASTFHPPTLDLLDRLGVAADLVAAGRPAGRVQYRDRALGVMADFDLSVLAGQTA
ncbi:MAG TPA: FAD-dependent oxidoreductase, partial [Mycobacteriales bacterium]|nr:FAD-dependent oxidoreductase [Mycobacteriales bacterium]